MVSTLGNVVNNNVGETTKQLCTTLQIKIEIEEMAFNNYEGSQKP